MVKNVKYVILFFIMSFLLGANAINASASVDKDKMTFDDFLLECEDNYVPGELYIGMKTETDIQTFLESIPPVKISYINDKLENLYFTTIDAKNTVIHYNSLFFIRLVDKSYRNLYKTAQMLLMQNDVKFVSPHIIISYDHIYYSKIPSPILRYISVTVGDDRWNEAAMYDFSNDGIIDVDDLIIILANGYLE